MSWVEVEGGVVVVDASPSLESDYTCAEAGSSCRSNRKVRCSASTEITGLQGGATTTVTSDSIATITNARMVGGNINGIR